MHPDPTKGETAPPTESATSNSTPGDRFADSPIASSDDDEFGRARLASHFAAVVRDAATSSDSVVTAIIGPWGSGKTSFGNMLCRELGSTVRVLRFNPWLVTGESALLVDFINTLLGGLHAHGKPLRKTRRAAQKLVGASSRVAGLIPIVGAKVKDPLNQLEALIDPDMAAAKLHTQLADDLRNEPTPLLVVVDDVDRLDPAELLALFKVVRLIGRLPNLHYLILFDEQTMLDLLSQAPGMGGSRPRAADYVEKIVQVRIDLPPVTLDDIRSLLSIGVGALFRADLMAQHRGSAEQRLERTLNEILAPRLREPRRAKRLIAQVASVLPAISGEVDPSDLLLLTHLRSTYPSLYRELASDRDLFSSSLAYHFDRRNKTKEARLAYFTSYIANVGLDTREVDDAIELLAHLSPPVADATNRLLPGSGALEAERRLGAPEYYDRYFQLGVEADDVSDVEFEAYYTQFAENDDEHAIEAARSWLLNTAERTRTSLLRRLHRRLPQSFTEDEASRWLALLAEIYPRVSDYRGELHEPPLTTEISTAVVLAGMPQAGLADAFQQLAVANPFSGLRLLVRAAHITLLQKEAELGISQEWTAVFAAEVSPLLESSALEAAQEPLEANSALPWLFHYARTYAPTEDLGASLQRVIEHPDSMWTYRDLVGSFMGVGTYPSGRSFLTELHHEQLFGLVDRADLLSKLQEDLDLPRLNELPDYGDGDPIWNPSFEQRVLYGLRALRAFAT